MPTDDKISFNAGIFTKRLRQRYDIKNYKYSCNQLENFIPLVSGGIRKRQGTELMGDDYSTSPHDRLIPFEVSNSSVYILNYNHSSQHITFFTDAGQILNDDGTEYKKTNVGFLRNITYAQNKDIMYIATSNQPLKKLIRKANTNWTLEDVVFDKPSFDDENLDESKTITFMADGSNRYVRFVGFTTTEMAKFHARPQIIKLIRPVSDYAKWKVETDYAIGARRRYDGNVYISITAGTSGVIPPTHLRGTMKDNSVYETGVNWKYLHSGSGYIKTTMPYLNHYTNFQYEYFGGTTLENNPYSGYGSVSTFSWALSDLDDYNSPSCVLFYENRLWLSGVKDKPNNLWGSSIGKYESFDRNDTNDNSPVSFTILSGQSNTIKWMSDGSVLTVGSSGGQYSVTGGNRETAITPTSVNISLQTQHDADNVAPANIDNALVFAERGGRLREYLFNYNDYSFTTSDLTIFSQELLKSGVKEIVYQPDPDKIIWVLTQDNRLFGLTYDKQQEVGGWHEHTISGGKILSISNIPNSTTNEGELWILLRLATYSKLVRMKPVYTGDTDWFVDVGIEGEFNPPITTIPNLQIFINKDIVVRADGNNYTDLVVSDEGVLELKQPASKILVGLPIKSIVETNYLEIVNSEMVSFGKNKQIKNVRVYLLDTPPSDLTINEQEVITRPIDEINDTPLQPFTGFSDRILAVGSNQPTVSLTLKHSEPSQCNIQALVYDLYTVNEL